MIKKSSQGTQEKPSRSLLSKGPRDPPQQPRRTLIYCCLPPLLSNQMFVSIRTSSLGLRAYVPVSMCVTVLQPCGSQHIKST